MAAGACFFYVSSQEISPTRFVSGRALALEKQLVEIVPDPFDLTEHNDPLVAWTHARTSVDAGDPVLLLTDIYYLEYYDRAVHFPGHAVVLAGYDDHTAYLADTDRPGLSRTSLKSLEKARFSTGGPIPVRGEALRVTSPEALSKIAGDLPGLCRKATGLAARQMLEPSLSQFQGIPALRRLASEIARWPDEVEDWKWCARFAWQTIERRGTGGGNFRALYAEFLSYASEIGAGDGFGPLTSDFHELASAWTRLAVALRAAGDREDVQAEEWTSIAEQVEELAMSEERAWIIAGEVAVR